MRARTQRAGELEGAAFEPLFLADWDDVTFVHFAFDPADLQPHVPFALDLFKGRAYVSLVAFTQRRLRPRVGGRLGAILSAPLATHEFLNIRTYVRRAGETGIFFLCEWIPNRLATWVGPPLYGLPYRLGRLRYRYNRERCIAKHAVIARGLRLEFDANVKAKVPPAPAKPGTLEAFLIERYVAFTHWERRDACFRARHAPWTLQSSAITLREAELLGTIGLPWDRAIPVGGNFSEGLKDVGLGAPERLSIEHNALIA